MSGRFDDALNLKNKKNQKPGEKKRWEPPVPTRIGRKKKKGPSAAYKLPQGNTSAFTFSLSKYTLQTEVTAL